MPRVFKTPGVYREEIDLSEILIPGGISDGGVVLRAKKGPINRPVLISNDKEFVETFGEPIYVSGTGTSTTLQKLTPEWGYGAYAALEFLKESSTLYVVRDYDSDNDVYAEVAYETDLSVDTSAYKTSALDYSITVSAGTRPSGVIDRVDRIYSIDTASENMSTQELLVAALGPGTDGNDIAVTIEPFSISADWKFTYDGYPTSSDAASASLSVAEMVTYYPIGVNVFKMNVYTKPSTANWSDYYTLSGDQANNRLRISPVETFYGSLTSQVDGNNNQLYIEDVVNGNSQYIYVKTKLGASTRFTPFTSEAQASNLPVKEDSNGTEYVDYQMLGELSGGVAPIPNETALTSTTNWDLFENREEVNVGILICPTYKTAVKQEVARVTAKRLDCIAVVQAADLTKETTTNVLDQEEYGYQSPSYVAIYAGYAKVYDKYNDKFVFLPNAIFGASLMARTDRIANPWDAPAGIDRGTLSVLDQRKIWTSVDIGKLYEKNINTTKFHRGVGHVMWGQKTAQMKASALDRINVRRNLLYIENNVEPALVQFIFENNTSKTRLRVFSLVDSFLAGVQAGGGLTAYQVVVDESNNTADVIDANQMIVDIYVQPVRAIEFIQLRTIITRTGVSFEQIV